MTLALPKQTTIQYIAYFLFLLLYLSYHIKKSSFYRLGSVIYLAGLLLESHALKIIIEIS